MANSTMAASPSFWDLFMEFMFQVERLKLTDPASVTPEITYVFLSRLPADRS
jgi:hypothetical protein